MATYLQGVTDYIPQLQPFQPDLNLYANVLQTKQTQYDTAWKSLNSVYGQYYYADLSRENNIERKEEIIKNIDFNLKRVAGLDLSLTQNVQQATQVFKPFYEDKYLMKDMAWTKNYSNQRNRAEGYKNSLKEEQRGMYWDGGVRAMDYMKEEFQESSDADSLSFGNAEYTPYVNAIKEAQKVAKEAGLSIEADSFSEDGRWIVTTKNGEQLIPTLSRLFEAQLGSDPAIQAVYKTQAYLDRKDYASSNAAQFNGDKNAAEMQYLQNNYTMLKEQQRIQYQQMEEENSSYDAKIKDVEKQLKTKKSADLTSYLEQLKYAKKVNQDVLDRVAADNDALAEQDGTVTTTTGQQNPYGDLKSLRWKVDNAVASSLMQKDLNEAAQIFAMKDAKKTIEANPYAVNEQKHQFAMQEVALRNQGLANAAKIRNAGEMEKLKMQAALDAGIAAINPKTGELEYVQSYDTVYTTADLEGAAAFGQSFATVNRQLEDRTANAYGVPYVQNSLALLKRAQEQGVITDKEVKDILGMDLATATEKFKGNNTAFVTRLMQSKGLDNMKTKMDGYISSNNKLQGIRDQIPGFSAANTNFGGYVNYQKEVEKWRVDSSTEVKQKLESQGFDDGDFLFDKNGHMRGYEEFKANVIAKHGSSSAPSYEEYADVWRAANDIYSSNMSTKAPPGISKSVFGGGAVASTGQQNISVSNKAPGTLGYQYFREFEREFRNTPYSNFTTGGDRISINGQDYTAYNNYDNQKGQMIYNHIVSKMGNTKDRFNFDLAAAPIAANDSNIGAMVIRVTPDMIKDLVSTDKENSNNLLTKEEGQAVVQNGLTMFKEGGWNNGLYSSSYMDPISAVIDHTGSYSETHPSGDSKIKIEPDPLGLDAHQITETGYVYDAATGDRLESIYTYRSNLGRNGGMFVDTWNQGADALMRYNDGMGY
jgi:hypothetical protein